MSTPLVKCAYLTLSTAWVVNPMGNWTLRYGCQLRVA